MEQAHWTNAQTGAAQAGALVSLLGACLGVTCALVVARAGVAMRVLILAALFALLALPAPPIYALPSPAAAPLPLIGAVGRALALVALFCIPNAAAIPPGLRRAALAAGATPLRAWRDAVLTQIWLPACIGIIAAWFRS